MGICLIQGIAASFLVCTKGLWNITPVVKKGKYPYPKRSVAGRSSESRGRRACR